MKKGLFLDDERMPYDVTWLKLPYVKWTIVRTVKQFESAYKAVDFDVVSLDHDLQDFAEGFEQTGKHAAMLIVHLDDIGVKPLPEIIVHSMNPVGKENIEQYIDFYLRYKGLK